MRRRAWWFAAGYAVLAAVFVNPLVDFAHLADATYPGDARLIVWTLAWDAHALLSGTPLMDANMFHPAPQALTWAEHHIGIALFALPFYALTGNPVLAYWAVWLLSFPLNALAMHALAWRLTRQHLAAAAAAIVYAFCFFRMHHGHGHVQLLWTWPLPLIPLAIERWLAKPGAAHTALLTALLLVQALTSWYLTVFVALLGVVTMALLVKPRELTARHVAYGAAALAVTGGMVAWFARPYFSLQTPGIAEAFESSADAAAYVLPPENTWPGQWLMAYTTWKPRWIWGEQTLYVGTAAMALAAVGAWALIRRRPIAGSRLTWALLATGVAALLLSFGPSPAGTTPFDLFARVPGMSMLRSPARFALLVMLALATLVAYGAAYLTQRYGRRGAALSALLAAVFLAESFVVDFPAGKPRPFDVPVVYRHLTSLPRGAVLSLPSYRGSPEGFREADYLLYSTAHWYPIANGFGRHEPLPHRENVQAFGQFPAPQAVARLRQLGIHYVVVHTGRDSRLRDAVAAANNNPNVQPIGQFGDDYLFRVP